MNGLSLSTVENAQKLPLLLFVQPFGLSGVGGGPRIYRALLENAPLPFDSVVTSPASPPAPRFGTQHHLPQRYSLGRIERTRFSWICQHYEFLRLSAFERRIEQYMVEHGVAAVHVLAHSTDCFAAARAARRLRLPLFLTVHDDMEYHYANSSLNGRIRPQLHELWNEADCRFVISEAMGTEYCARYGAKPYTIVTDGIETLSPLYTPGAVADGPIYFGGLFHIGYEPNLKALLAACASLASGRGNGKPVELLFRCEHARSGEIPPGVKFDVLPFAHESVVAQDIEKSSLLYLPMKFGEDDSAFSRFSLSTKMITYLASGRPMLYHGPVESAAAEILRKYDAAIMCYSLEPEEIKQCLLAGDERRLQVAANALTLAKEQFLLETQRRRFWSPILETLKTDAPGSAR